MRKLFHPQTVMGYHTMVWIFKTMDLFGKPDKRLDDFAIPEGGVVVDYGCGPGRYIRRASERVGPGGRVYALDINRIAIDIVKKKVRRYNLANVVPVLAGGREQAIADHCADVVYALDMFHQIGDPVGFLAAIHRVAKKDGVLYLEDGHQPREKTLEKIGRSGLWEIAGQSPRHVTLAVVG